ncbi:CubicO group peptidase (beta-lactamase class C family) [Chitinophaga dinghuensis]|uniref:CubicO group peptidase (Beta-lactamase class C family) n=1 Tax=Chitinophaga dinghuensis TaxID=1539050 RepID=A0A327W042_9BACT|nr:serine hydrolase domain-containing protein [Chitinophaga dinghuensis]RAJ81993.1 CubicO group peptidase (beta-lactamase class C family) [Chitinophaga dinghuensis]
MKLLIALLLLVSTGTYAQRHSNFADSIRQHYNIPELAYAVVCDTGVMETQIFGTKKINSHLPAAPSDRFRIGSNTKAITSLLIAQQIQAGRLTWNTPFFAIFPELKAKSKPCYYDMTVADLLSFRNPLMPYSYGNEEPRKNQFPGTPSQQRMQFAAWLLQQPPNTSTGELKYSNAGYVLAGALLEKISGHTYEELLQNLNTSLSIHLQTGSPNEKDSTQTWGHNDHLQPEASAENYKLNWLMAAGNVNTNLSDYTILLSQQLKAFKGASPLLDSATVNFLHFGRHTFAMGWFWEVNKQGHQVSSNTGNPGTFITRVVMIPAVNRAYVVFTNYQEDKVYEGVNALITRLQSYYGE